MKTHSYPTNLTNAAVGPARTAVSSGAYVGGACGYDGAKKLVGRKRHIFVDTEGLLLAVNVHPANIMDRDGIKLVLDD